MAQAWAQIVRFYREQGEDGLRTVAKQSGLDDAVIEQIKGMDKPE